MPNQNKTLLLSAKAKKAQTDYLSGLDIKKRRTQKPLVVAFIGLVGSGKSSVAKELAGYIGGTVVEGDAIRVCLRHEGEPYKYVRLMSENIAVEIIKQGGNVLLDADFIDGGKRAELKKKAGEIGARLVFVCTYAEPDVMFGRILSASYQKHSDDFFGGAKTNWKKGTEQQTGAVIKFREAWRRTPRHYRWTNEGGGKWTIKNPPLKAAADIDTTDPVYWKAEVKKLADKLLK